MTDTPKPITPKKRAMVLAKLEQISEMRRQQDAQFRDSIRLALKAGFGLREIARATGYTHGAIAKIRDSS